MAKRMAKRPSLEDTLLRLRELRSDPGDPDALAELREILGGRLSHAIARVAEIAEQAQLSDLIPDLVDAFGRMMKNPSKSDPICRAKETIADALQLLDAREEDLFLSGVAHVQLEPTASGLKDTAAGLRGAAARGLVRMNYPDVMLVLAELLADPEFPARIAAARAIAYHRGEQALPLLRLKVLSGDPEPDVIGECLLAMMQISVERSLDFIERLLNGDDGELIEGAALALGESRAPEALPVLTRWWERTVDPDLSRTGLLAIAMLRRDEAIDFLLGLIANEPGPMARDAIRAFEIYRGDEAMIERVRETVAAREDLDLLPTFEQEFA